MQEDVLGVEARFDEAASLGNDFTWYLSHSLHSDVFLRNTAPGVLDGTHGVAPAIPEGGAVFPAEFRRRWPGEDPSIPAYYAFDALAGLALAIGQAATISGTGEVPTGRAISLQMRSVASSSAARSTAPRLAMARPAAARLLQNRPAVMMTGR